MSSSTEQRSHTTGPTPAADDTTVAIPRPVGPWAQPSFAPQAPHAVAAGWPGPAPWTVPPAGMGPIGPGTPAPARSGMRWGWVVIAVVAAVAAVMLIGTVAANNRTLTMSGTVAVAGTGYLTPGTSCSMTSAVGLPVTIYDASGDLVGTTTLSGSSGIARNTWSSSYYSYADSCEFSFTINDVAATADHYRVKIGSGTGDGVGYSREQLESGVQMTYR